MRKAPERGRRAWSLSHVPWSLIDESVRIHRLLFGSDLLLSHEMVEPCLFSPAEPVDSYGLRVVARTEGTKQSTEHPSQPVEELAVGRGEGVPVEMRQENPLHVIVKDRPGAALQVLAAIEVQGDGEVRIAVIY